MNENLKVLNGSFDKLADILSKIAVQDVRIKAVEEDIRELKHGRGFVQGSVTGEYTNRGKIG